MLSAHLFKLNIESKMIAWYCREYTKELMFLLGMITGLV